jgi:hypothetical protein
LGHGSSRLKVWVGSTNREKCKELNKVSTQRGAYTYKLHTKVLLGGGTLSGRRTITDDS